MKKIITAVMGTISGLVLLFSYHTSTNAEATTSAEDEESPAESGISPLKRTSIPRRTFPYRSTRREAAAFT